MPWEAALGGAGIGVARAFVGHPMQRWTYASQVQNLSAWETLSQTKNIWAGLSAEVCKHITKTPANFLFTYAVSRAVPHNWSPHQRGFAIGGAVACLESIIIVNPLNVMRARLMEGQRLNAFFQFEGVYALSKGWDATLIHRALSGVVFFSVYEDLKKRFPDHPFWVSTAAGWSQVVTTAPFHAAMTHKQKVNGIGNNVFKTMQKIAADQGTFQGLVGRGLAFRLFHSSMVSGPLMWVMEKLHVINRSVI